MATVAHKHEMDRIVLDELVMNLLAAITACFAYCEPVEADTLVRDSADPHDSEDYTTVGNLIEQIRLMHYVVSQHT